MKISIVIPAKNEAANLNQLLAALKRQFSSAELIVVNDGSTDNTSEICRQNQVIEVENLYSMGNGAAIKAGARKASHDVLVFMDGDGQHDPADIERLLNKIEEGYDLVVGARQGLKSQANVFRGGANGFYNKLASLMTGHKVEDLTSGFRAFRKSKFFEFIHLLPNGFSYPTTSTMAFFRAGYPVAYVPIDVKKRVGKSHIRLVRDGARFLLIIFKIGTLYSPMKVFAPVALMMFLLATGWYGYTFATTGRFTNMSALLYTGSVMVFLMGLISEQITALLYSSR